MTALQKSILDRKIEFMRKALEEIEKILKQGESNYLSNNVSQAVMERQIERLVEAAVDAGAHILRHKRKLSAPTYRETFLELGKQNFIDVKLAEDLAPAAGLRNVISHLYDEIDPKRVFDGAKKAVSLFPQFIAQISKIDS